jgi:two-component system, NtrC family, sensor kinase
MKRRSRAGGEAIKGRRRKTPEPKRRDAPKAVARPNSSPAAEETEVARLTRELSQALEQQAATSEVLNVIGSSPGELEQVFGAILEKATRICEANFGLLFRLDDGVIQTVVRLGVPPALAEFLRPGLRPGPNTATARAIRTGHAIHILDIREERGYLQGDPMLCR